ncbi:MAG TPA: hypothetical protein VD908_13265 [Cytophagales bacterium]|nr:hypothetical protein [Cytophagales bacterium]
MITKNFIKSSFLYTIGGALPMATGFILLPTYVNNLSKEDYSFFIILQILFLFFQTIGILNIDISTQSYYFDYKNDPAKLRRFVGTLVSNMLMTGVVITLFFSLTGPFLFELIFPETAYSFFPYVFIAVIIGVCFSFFKSYSNFLIVRQKPERFFLLSFGNFFLTVILSILLLKLIPDSLVGPVYGRLVPVLIVFCTALVFFIKEFGIHYDKKFTKDIINYSLPSLINVIIIWALGNVDRLIISGQMEKLDLIVYDIAWKIAMILEFVLTGLTNSIYPKIMNSWADFRISKSSVEENRYHHVFTLLTIFLIALLNVASPVILPFLFKKEAYLLAINFIPLLALQFLFRGFFNLYFYPIYYFKRTKSLPRIFILLALIQVTASFTLIYYMGLMGAIAAILISKLIQVILLRQESKKVFTYKFNKVKMLYLPIFYGCLIVSGELLFRESNKIILYASEFLIITLIIGLVYKSEIISLIERNNLLRKKI